MSRLKLAVALAGAMLLMVSGCGDSDLATGAACTADTECAEGKCHAGLCVAAAPKDDGAACTNNGECKSLNCSAAKCASGSTAKDAACLNNEECASGTCENGKCSLKANGKACKGDNECKGGVCASDKCATKCDKASDCATGEVCHSTDMKKTFCMKPTYDKNLGTKCGKDGQCAGGKCYGTTYDAKAWCGGSCKADTDCPPNMACAKQSSGNVCQPRTFCSACANDSFCPNGFKCASMFGGKYCTTACTKGGSDCPMYAECKDAGGGNYVCMHKAGKCVGDGSDCAPCVTSGDCPKSQCLTLNLSGESFCSTDCGSGGACSNGTKCMQISSSGAKGCVPGQKGTPPYYTCTAGISFPIYQKDDIFPDFEMVGLADSNGDGLLTDEKLTYTKLSDFAGRYDLVLFNIMTFW